MTLDADTITRMVWLELGRAHSSDLATGLRAAEACGVRVLLASAWRAEGKPLSSDVEEELAFWNGQIARYRIAYGLLEARIPSIEVQKGIALQDLYPAGWIRDCGDLDLTLGSRRDVWAAAALLREHGWDSPGCSLILVGDRLEVVVGLWQSPPANRFSNEQRIELASIRFAGNSGTVPPCSQIVTSETPSARIRHLLAILEERFERTFGVRDVIDGSVLIQGAEAIEMRAFFATLDRLSLWPEWRHLLRRMRMLDADPRLPIGPLGPYVGALARRGARWLAMQRHPARWAAELLDRLTVLRPPSDREAALAWWIHTRVSVRSVLEANHPIYGYRLDEDAAADDLELENRNGRLLARTPIGTYLMTYSGAVDARWLTSEDEARLASS
ncbi:MAG: nucleotidyltransferase family protein [Candidatus Eisenbacteria bacterium]|uniref:Nucleotidyltransferase family protein n=1 Tax=Eiseniibacteriota bacterium TaxID=2212470 RepID=A0A538U021_UNCEI|nr:MAG: nucleotidyltransferase family protein [Candidatus Eisenbacteria bacterium]